MNNLKISQLNETTSPQSTDVIPIVNSGETKKVELQHIISAAFDASKAAFVPLTGGTVTGNIDVTGNVGVSGNLIVPLGNSTEWVNTYTTVKANSADWNSVYSSTLNASANWENTYSAVNSNSADWNSVYSTTLNASADWKNTYTAVDSNSANWNSVYSTTLNNSANWDSVYSTVLNTSSDWENTYSVVNSNSADWDSVYSTTLATSANWDSVYSTVLNASSDWETTYSVVNSNSADWKSVYSTTLTNSATWQAAITGQGIVNYIAKFTTNSKTITSSQIFDDGTNIGIGTTSPNHKLTLNGSFSSQGSIFTSGNATIDQNLLIDNGTFFVDSFSKKIGVNTKIPSATVHVSGNDGIVIPSGNSLQRPTPAVQGTIRYNNQNSIFEGFDGAYWGTLGGVKDVDQDTYISAEIAPGVDNDQLKFFTAGTEQMVILSSGHLGIGVSNPTEKLVVDGNSHVFGNGKIDGDLNIFGNLSALGSLTYLDTVVTTTSALSVLNVGGPVAALTVSQTGPAPVANFLDDGASALFIDGASSRPGHVGISTSTPNEKLTVQGNISASDIIFAGKFGNSQEWNTVYSSTLAKSANWDSVYSSTLAKSATWDSVYSTTLAKSANWDSVYSTTLAKSATWQAAITGQGIVNYIAKFTTNSKTITSSQIFDDGMNVGIRTSTPNESLTVVGKISASDDIITPSRLKIGTPQLDVETELSTLKTAFAQGFIYRSAKQNIAGSNPNIPSYVSSQSETDTAANTGTNGNNFIGPTRTITIPAALLGTLPNSRVEAFLIKFNLFGVLYRQDGMLGIQVRRNNTDSWGTAVGASAQTLCRLEAGGSAGGYRVSGSATEMIYHDKTALSFEYRVIDPNSGLFSSSSIGLTKQYDVDIQILGFYFTLL